MAADCSAPQYYSDRTFPMSVVLLRATRHARPRKAFGRACYEPHTTPSCPQRCTGWFTDSHHRESIHMLNTTPFSGIRPRNIAQMCYVLYGLRRFQVFWRFGRNRVGNLRSQFRNNFRSAELLAPPIWLRI